MTERPPSDKQADASIGRFISRAAHGLRTPLAIIALKLGRIDGPVARDIERDIEAMNETIGRLLYLARLEALSSLDLRPVNLAVVINDVVEELQPQLSARGNPVEINSAKDAAISANPDAVRRAVYELLGNASRHAPPGTQIAIGCDRDGACTISDGGPGFAAIDDPGLFEPFSDAPEETAGARLGLATVRRIMELHQGRLELAAVPRGGAKVSLYFAPLGA